MKFTAMSLIVSGIKMYLNLVVEFIMFSFGCGGSAVSEGKR